MREEMEEKLRRGCDKITNGSKREGGGEGKRRNGADRWRINSGER